MQLAVASAKSIVTFMLNASVAAAASTRRAHRMWQVAFIGPPWPNTQLDSALAAEIEANKETMWHRVERPKTEEALSRYTRLPPCLHRHIKVVDVFYKRIILFKIVHMTDDKSMFWAYRKRTNEAVLFKQLHIIVLTAHLSLVPSPPTPKWWGESIQIHVTNMVGNTIWKAEVPASAHMFQIGKAVGKEAQELMNLTNVEVQHAKVLLMKSSKQWVLRGTVEQMLAWDTTEELEQEVDREKGTSRPQEIRKTATLKHQLKDRHILKSVAQM